MEERSRQFIHIGHTGMRGTWGLNRGVRRCVLSGSRPGPAQLPQPRQAEIGLPRPLKYLRAAPLNMSVGRGKVFSGWTNGAGFRSLIS